MIVHCPGRARARLLVACFVSSCLAAGLAYAQDLAPVAAPSDVQNTATTTTTISESVPLTVFGWGDAEPVVATEQPATQESTAVHESSAEQEQLAPQDMPATSANTSTDTATPPSLTTTESMPLAVGAVAPTAEGSVSNVVSEPAAAESANSSSIATEAATPPVPAATETQASTSVVGGQRPDTLGGDFSSSVTPAAVEVTAIKTPQSSEAQVVPVTEPAALGSAEATNTPAP